VDITFVAGDVETRDEIGLWWRGFWAHFTRYSIRSTRYDLIDRSTLSHYIMKDLHHHELFQLFGITIHAAGSLHSVPEAGPVEGCRMWTNGWTSAIKMSISMFLNEKRKYFECVISIRILNDTGVWLTTGAIDLSWLETRAETGKGFAWILILLT
jgi:hypothetical protein